MHIKVPIITIDGPAASGKGTVALKISRELGWKTLNSGLIYRVIALEMIKRRISVVNTHEIVSIIKNSDIVNLYEMNIRFKKSSILSEKVGNYASIIAKIPEVRHALLKSQRGFQKPPGLVADGRDMGTVVFPDAELKIFLTADINVRVKRRQAQLIARNISVNLNDLSSDLKKRDLRDSLRESSPLTAAPGACFLDSSELSVNETVQSVLSFWKKYFGPVS